MIVKIHKRNNKTIVAVCDDNLLGKVFEENSKILDLNSSFYDGDKLTEIETGDLLRNADVFNLVGEKSIRLGIEEDVIEEDTVKRISGIPYAHAYFGG